MAPAIIIQWGYSQSSSKWSIGLAPLSFICRSPSAPARQAGLDSGGSFGWLWRARNVLASERSTACPGPMPVTSKVARHLRASMVGQLGAGLASFRFHLQPQLYRPGDQISPWRRLAIFLNGSLSVFALRRIAKVVRFRASAIVSTLFAFRTSARSFLSCSAVQGARGVPVISPSPQCQWT
jgi:hypothetical protein